MGFSKKSIVGGWTALIVASAALSVQAGGLNLGAPIPDPGIPGFSFPTPTATIDGWINQLQTPDTPADAWQNIHAHGWGIWTAITMPTKIDAPGLQDVPVYATWLTPEEIGKLSGPQANTFMASEPVTTLRPPKQFHRSAQLMEALKTLETVKDAPPDTPIFETVGYSPTAAYHAYTQKLLQKSTLDTILANGDAMIPAFPASAVAVKPVYMAITKADLGNNGLYKMAAWPGTPDPAQAYPATDWDQCIYVSITNKGQGNGTADPNCNNPTPQTTYNLDSFIHFTVTENNKIFVNNATGGQTSLQAGDYLILVGMHVSSKENTQWTWQTFWWSYTPDNPNSPSSKAIADARPDQLKGPARNYAMSTAYTQLVPNQPMSGGKSQGYLMPAYNPHLEAPFPPDTFNIKGPVTLPDGTQVVTEYGVQSNCMTCHSLAAYGGSGTGYASNVYIGFDNPVFNGALRTDFLWSIPDDAQ